MVVRPAVVLLSTLAHALLVAFVARLAARPSPSRDAPTPPSSGAKATAATTPNAAPEPIEVVFLETEANGPAASDVPHGASTSRSLARTSEPSPPTTPLGDPGASTVVPAPRSATAGTGSLLRMRGVESGTGPATESATTRPVLALAPSAAERIAASRTGPPADELRESGRLEPRPGGGAIVRDRVTTMTVHPDGTVDLDDAKDIDLSFQLPIPKIWRIEEMRQSLGRELTTWFADPEAGKRYGTTSDLPRHLQASQGACDTWGAAFCDDPLAPESERRVRERKAVNGPLFGGGMDITAWLHRKFVGDPYASRKRKLLADTLDERVAMGSAHRAEQRARSAELVQRNIERLWARERNPVARRAALFELWDECGEDEDGMRARAMVIGWIRTHLPADSPDAYTAQELELLQKRRTSAMPFEPYLDRQ